MKKPNELYLLLFERAWTNFEQLKKESPHCYEPAYTKRNSYIKNAKRQWVLNRY